MKKSPPTPDLNAKAPRPRHISDEDPDVPTMDSPPPAASDTSTGFDRGTAATDQDYRSGLLPGSNDFTPQEQTEDQLEGREEEMADVLKTGSTETDESRPQPQPSSQDNRSERAVEAFARADAGGIGEDTDQVRDLPFAQGEDSPDEWTKGANDPAGTENPLQGPPETFPQQDDPDQEGVFEQPGSPNHEPVYDPENETLGAVKAPADDADDPPGTDRTPAPSGEVNASQSMNTRDTRDTRAVDQGLGSAMDRLGDDDPTIDRDMGEGSPYDVAARTGDRSGSGNDRSSKRERHGAGHEDDADNGADRK